MILGLKRINRLLILSALFCSTSMAQLYDGHSLKPAHLDQLVSRAMPGTILIVGENHGQPSQQAQQLQILQALREAPFKLSVGLEFMWYTDQAAIEAYRLSQITEQEFLKSWRGGFDFNLYKAQLVTPIIERGEYSLGLNLPQPIASKIGKLGLEGLTPEDWKIMPYDFQLGRDSYKQRFIEQMGGHGGPNIDKYFAAQSAWDDTMAWQSVKFMKQHPDHVLVIIVGEFHVQYGGGLPDRIRARLRATGLDNSIITVSQVMTYGMTEEEITQSMQPSMTEGPRADFILLDSSKPVSSMNF